MTVVFNFNAGILQMVTEATDAYLEAVVADPGRAAPDDKDRALLVFVVQAVKTPGATTAGEIEALREMGWTDQDILDATCHGADMVRHDTVFKAFKMDEQPAPGPLGDAL